MSAVERRTSAWPAYAAAAWAVVFAAMSFAWAAGVMLGSDTLGVEIDRLARERESGFVATLWITGALKLLAALLPLGLVWTGTRPARARLVRPLRIATLLAGAGMTLYALLNAIQHALMATGAIATPDGLGSDAVPWHLALWDPFWLLGGLLFLAAARAAQQDRRPGGRMG